MEIVRLRSFQVIVFLVVLIVGPLAVAGPAKYLIFFGVDGLKPDYYWDADRHGLKIPAVRALIERGSYSKAVEGVLPTITFPSDTTLVTGVNPARHGIISNTPFDPTNENLGGWYWYAQDLRVKTLWDVAHEKGLITAALDWPVTAGAKIDFNIPEIWRAGSAEDVKLVRLLSTPSLIDELEARFGRIPTPYRSTDEERGKVASYVVEHKRPNLTLVYFSDLDETQHKHGPYTPEAFETLEMIDRQIGLVVEATRSAGIYEQTVFAVASDHGFAKVQKQINPMALFRSLGLVETDAGGRVKNWKVAMDGSAVVIKDKQDSETLGKIRRILSLLAEFPEYGIARICERAEIEKLGGYPNASLLLEPAEGFSIGGSANGSFLENESGGGTHGLPAHFPSMKASFILAGPGVKKGIVLSESKMIDIAPTLARILGVTLADAEGRPLKEMLED